MSESIVARVDNDSIPRKSCLAVIYRVLVRLQRFVLAGGVVTMLHWCVMAGAIWGNAHPWVASSIGMMVGALAGYRLQCRFVFRYSGSRKTLFRYSAALAIATIANLAVLACLRQFGLGILTAQCIATLAVGAVNFVVLHVFVFRSMGFAPVSVR